MPAAKKWPLQGLSLGPCGTLNYPFGVAIFAGYYTSANISTATPLSFMTLMRSIIAL